MKNVLMRVRDAVTTSVFGSPVVCCETCGETLRPSRAVWRGQRSYCSAAHEYADLDTEDLSSPVFAARATEDAGTRSMADLVRS
ncbi:hypothetical protein [uncultured Microbacterium sp.]|uniref:hypothetical protein n=1 Tax=uncultured Microbacterium sp. TaxID=191216 RepID=UPI0028D2F4A9|nr:hypothetical protein [uncultured Microbacterium sp.]